MKPNELANKNYVVISPCRNEQEYMRLTLNSVVRQTLPPAKWIIVDDGSTDDTANILAQYAKNYSFITIVTRKNRGHRSVGPGVIDAFYEGYNTINIDDYDYICKLDLDLDIPLDYFERLMQKMESNNRLGTYSGKPYFYDKENDNKLVFEVCGDESSVGMTKFYRVACFKEIGGFVRKVMWDGIDSHRCRLLGWISQSEDIPELRFVHLRPMGSSQKNILTGRVRHGYGQYYMGTSVIYLLASVIYRLDKKPYVIGALATLWGYLRCVIMRENKLYDPKMQKMMRRSQLRSLIKGKKQTFEQMNAERGKYWGKYVETYKIPNNS